MTAWLREPKNRVILNGRPAYQGRKQMMVLDHCPLDRRRTMIDAGAHCGLWAYNFAKYFNWIEAFEPVAAHRECFGKNIPDEMHHRIAMHPYALGENGGRVAIKSNPSSSGDSWVNGPGDIEMRTIDSFELTEVDLIKVDAEGFEEKILRGAEQTLRQWKPVVCVEQKRSMAEKFGLKPQGALVYLKSLGYRSVAEMSGDYVLRAD